MTKVISAEQAAGLIKNGATIAIATMGLTGRPEEIAQAVEKRFLETGTPRDLCLVQGSACGDWKERGTTRWGHEGLIKKWIGALIGSSAGLSKLLMENKMEAYCLPQGVIVNLWREIAAGRPGLITKVGLDTFVDPRVEGGRMNSITVEDIVKVVEFDGEEWLFYRSFPVDVALIRGTTADTNGNISVEKDSVILEALQLAQATKKTGGIVIAQVEYLAEAGSIHPKKVRVPGILVDYVVVATKQEACWQTEGLYYNPAFAGDIKVPIDMLPEIPFDERKIIVRRAAMELKQGAVVNLGFGMPTAIASIAAEENVYDMITLTTEAGGIGGVPANPPNFGSSYNPEAIIEHNAMFDFYDGGGLDLAFLGLAQADAYGNVNVSKFGKPNGCGGFINISQNSKKVVYTGTFTAGGLKVKIEDAKLKIENEGRNIKFLKNVEQITFSGKYAQKVKQPVLYITERCVFELGEKGLTLIEIAPGIDPERDIFPYMEFRPEISPDLKEMPGEIFRKDWQNLRNILLSQSK